MGANCESSEVVANLGLWVINECLYYCHDYKSQRPKTKIHISYLFYDYCAQEYTHLLQMTCMYVCIYQIRCINCFSFETDWVCPLLWPINSVFIYTYTPQTTTLVPILSFFFVFIFNFIIHSAKAIKKLLRKHAIYSILCILHIYTIYIAADNVNARLAALLKD